MKLKAGQKYVLRNGRIEKCLAVWTDEVYGYRATVTYHPGGFGTYTLDGKFYTDGKESRYDIVSEYKEPKNFEAKIHLWNSGEVTVTNESVEFHPDLKIVETRTLEWEVPDNG